MAYQRIEADELEQMEQDRLSGMQRLLDLRGDLPSEDEDQVLGLMAETIAFLVKESGRQKRLISDLSQRVKALEPPSENA